VTITVELDIERVLDISTGHLTEEQCNTVVPSCKMLEVLPRDHGFFVIVPWFLAALDSAEDAECKFERQRKEQLVEEIGENPARILSFAAEKGLWGVLFDAAAETYPDLFPLYDW
jgi:hypothetical protein